VPAGTISWVKSEEDFYLDDISIRTSGRIAVDQTTGSLYFANVLTSDDSNYRRYKTLYYQVKTFNPYLDITSGGRYQRLTVLPNPVMVNRAPQRMIPEHPYYKQYALKGESTVIQCFFGGLPTPEISWQRPSRGPPPSQIDCTRESNTVCVIHNVQYSDKGNYTCTGKNSVGKQSTTIELIVESKPSFKIRPDSQNATVGDSVTFMCQPDAIPKAQITWYSNGNEITRNNPGNPRILISEDGTNLTVINVCKTCSGSPPSDLQVFQCNISNKHGSDFESAYLNVFDK